MSVRRPATAGDAVSRAAEPRRLQFGNLKPSNSTRELRQQLRFWNSAEWAMNPEQPPQKPYPSAAVLSSHLDVIPTNSLLAE
jgi:hypothetical protein